MPNLTISVIVNLLALVLPLVNVFREVHYTRRDIAIFNGIGLVATGVFLIVYHPSLYIFKIPLAAFPLLQGLLGIGLTSIRNNLGTKILSSLASLIMLLIVLVLQLGLLTI